MNKDNFSWLMEWYSMRCNGDWEHSYGIKINTLDNLGWSVTIDIQGFNYDGVKNIAWQFVEHDDNDWYGYKIEDGKFEASGDPYKLEYLIQLFRNIVDEKPKQ